MSLKVWGGALLLTTLLIGCGSDDSATEPAGPLLLSNHFLNIAHRGGRKLAPEHTLVAYQNGLDVGADILELDVHATSDGVLVLMHDDTVDRTTNGTGAIKELTFAELRSLDAAYNFSEDGGQTFPYRGKGIQVPTLEEARRAPEHGVGDRDQAGDPQHRAGVRGDREGQRHAREDLRWLLPQLHGAGAAAVDARSTERLRAG
ncbi:MAG: glycerophosphodiester phosphodiesterase family protein [Polyangiaceae bacterium]